MANLDFLVRLSGWLQIAIIVFGLLTPSLAFIKWRVDKYATSLKEETYNQKLARLAPRTLTFEQKRLLVKKLSIAKGRPVAVASRMLDGESADYADEIAQLFKETGWDVGPTNRSSLNDFPGFLSLFVTGDKLEREASIIARSFQEVGINCHSEKISEGSISGQLADRVYVVVGRKR